MVRKFGSPLEDEKSSKLSELKHARIVKVIEGDKPRMISYCIRCNVSWPCLEAQKEAIDKGRIRRDS